MGDYSKIELDDLVLSYLDGEKVRDSLKFYVDHLHIRRARLRVEGRRKYGNEIKGLTKSIDHIHEILEDLSSVMFEARRRFALKSSGATSAEKTVG